MTRICNTIIGFVGFTVVVAACTKKPQLRETGEKNLETTNVQTADPTPTGPQFSNLSAGENHTCGVTVDGRLLCWGAFASDGVTQPGATRPTEIDASTDWASVDAGDGFTCALKTDGSLWCFASYEGNPLSSSRKALEPRPVRLGTRDGWDTVSAGSFGACALRDGGEVHCATKKDVVRATEDGELGDDALEAVAGVPPARAVASGLGTSCAVGANGELWCWGRVAKQLSSPPVRINERSDWTEVELHGASGCAVRAGEIYCWESDPTTAQPTDLDAAAPASLSVGGHVCVRTEGGWRCRGAFASGERGPDISSESATAPPRFDDWTTLTAGDGHTCGLRDSYAYCWGENTFGELGNGVSGGARATPTALQTDVTFSQIVTSVYRACGITSTGALYCWGGSITGQLGPGLNGHVDEPRRLLGDAKWRDVAVGNLDTCAVREDGALLCWGARYGARPRQIGSATRWRDVELDTKMCATAEDASLWCWLDGPDRPAAKLADGGWTGRFSVGLSSVCGMLKDRSGQCIQIRPTSAAKRPPFILAPTTWKDLDATGSMACGIRDDGTAWCLDEFDGKRPSAMYARPKLEPLDPNAPDARWAHLSVADLHGCAIRTDGSLWCWGFDRAGALGLGTDVERAKTPQRVGEQTWSSVTVGTESACGTTTDGKPHCWGRHYVIADGRWLQPEPQPVVGE